MPTLAQPRLNRSFVLRYDRAHETDSAVENNADAEFDAEIEAILATKGIAPEGCILKSIKTGNEHMDVNGISGVGRAQALGGVRPAQNIETPATSALSPQDEVQISSAAQALNELSQTSDVRLERIQRIQQEIAEGIYDDDAKLDAALDRFLDAYGLNDD